MFGQSEDQEENATLYSVLASTAGIFGMGNKRMEGLPFFKTDHWSLENNADINGGVNHFGSPFNFPEEFTSVYRLHPLVPDLIDHRKWENPNTIVSKVAVLNTVRGSATGQMHARGLENWGLSMGRQRLSLLQLRNEPHFLQSLPMPHLDSPSGKLDIVALDIIRDRERGIEYTRPHGFAISETQFHVFIINASRRLFSDRFFTSSFRPEFYSTPGYDRLLHNGPLEECPYPLEQRGDESKICNEPVGLNPMAK
jgi:hypothetical protein